MSRETPKGVYHDKAAAPPTAQQPADGVQVGKASVLRNLVPAQTLEKQAAQQFQQLKQQVAAKKALAPDANPELIRLRAIADRIIPHAERFNPRAKDWQWEVILIGSNQINAFCMPGGKIAFFTGILRQLQLTDDEVAMVMGHEIAHALREHAREQAGKNVLTKIGAVGLSIVTGGQYDGLINAGAGLLSLTYSRSDEIDADVVGLDIAARAGYDPRAAVTLWQKMSAANKGAPPQWLSTHPSGVNRIKEIQRQLPRVLPLYEKAQKPPTPALRAKPPAPAKQ
ncbi:MAG: M48 family metallopeptidase [Betaproteobacteria bacterium]|nr:M48 family metallopeptidase [Betaproteobacteria bacterium]